MLSGLRQSLLVAAPGIAANALSFPWHHVAAPEAPSGRRFSVKLSLPSPGATPMNTTSSHSYSNIWSKTNPEPYPASNPEIPLLHGPEHPLKMEPEWPQIDALTPQKIAKIRVRIRQLVKMENPMSKQNPDPELSLRFRSKLKLSQPRITEIQNLLVGVRITVWVRVWVRV